MLTLQHSFQRSGSEDKMDIAEEERHFEPSPKIGGSSEQGGVVKGMTPEREVSRSKCAQKSRSLPTKYN